METLLKVRSWVPIHGLNPQNGYLSPHYTSYCALSDGRVVPMFCQFVGYFYPGAEDEGVENCPHCNQPLD